MFNDFQIWRKRGNFILVLKSLPRQTNKMQNSVFSSRLPKSDPAWLCSASMSNKEIVKTFQNLVHTIHVTIDSYLRPYICESLPSSFKSLSAFGRHKNLHRGNAKIFTCDVCQKEFKTNSSLNGHKKFQSEKHLEEMKMLNSLAVLNAKRLSTLKHLWNPTITFLTDNFWNQCLKIFCWGKAVQMLSLQ